MIVLLQKLLHYLFGKEMAIASSFSIFSECTKTQLTSCNAWLAVLYNVICKHDKPALLYRRDIFFTGNQDSKYQKQVLQPNYISVLQTTVFFQWKTTILIRSTSQVVTTRNSFLDKGLFSSAFIVNCSFFPFLSVPKWHLKP